MIKEYKNNIKKIDMLNSDEKLLLKYIEDIEKEKIDCPVNLEENILYRISNSNNTSNITNEYLNKQDSQKNKVYKILQIVACTIFSLLIWEFGTLNISSLDKIQKESINIQSFKIYGTINEKVRDISDVMMTPFNMKGE